MGRVLGYLFYVIGSFVRWGFFHRKEKYKSILDQMKLADFFIGICLVVLVVASLRMTLIR